MSAPGRQAVFFAVNDSYGHSLGHYWARMVEDFSRALNERGLPTRVEYPDVDQPKRFSSFTPDEQPLVAINYNLTSDVMLSFEDAKVASLALLRCPIVTLFMDDPNYLAEAAARFERARARFGTADWPHLFVPMEPAHLKVWPFDKGPGFAQPQAGPALQSLPPPAPKAMAERSIEVMICGTLRKPKEKMVVDFGAGLSVDCMPLIEAVTDGAVAGTVVREHLTATRPDLDRARIASATVFVDRGARVRRRWRLARSLLKLPVTYFGNADPIAKVTFPKWTFRDSAPFDAIDAAMADTKIVLSDTINLKEAALMRMFYAQARGAAVATDMNPFLAREYADGASILAVSAGDDWRANEDKLRAHLAAPEKLAEVARAGQAIQAARHTWHDRADGLIPEIEKLIRAGKAA